MNPAEITDKLGLHNLRARNWWVWVPARVHGCLAAALRRSRRSCALMHGGGVRARTHTWSWLSFVKRPMGAAEQCVHLAVGQTVGCRSKEPTGLSACQHQEMREQFAFARNSSGAEQRWQQQSNNSRAAVTQGFLSSARGIKACVQLSALSSSSSLALAASTRDLVSTRLPASTRCFVQFRFDICMEQ